MGQSTHGSSLSKMLKVMRLYTRNYFLNSTVHGLPYIANRNVHLLENCFWILLVVIGGYGAAVLSTLTINRYYQNPTVISMERDRYSWNTSFPAVTVCPVTKLQNSALEQFVASSNSTKKSELKEFIKSLSEATYHNFDKVLNNTEISPEEYMNILTQLTFAFKPSLTNSGLYGNIQLDLQQSVTELGICYSFNSQLAVYNSPEYWRNNSWKLLPPKDEVLYVNPLDGEVFANMINLSTAFHVFIHGPYEVADIASKSTYSPNGYFLQLYLKGLTTFTTDNARNLGVDQRKCRFYTESNLAYSPVYSYVLCRMDCRASMSLRLCGCVPHFYRNLGHKICNIEGLHCLAKHKDRLILLQGECRNCLANCDDVNFILDNLDSKEWFLGSNFQWGLRDYPNMRLKRDVIFGFTDLIVYIGGMAGLFLGCSVLSFIEIIYFYTLRLFWFLMRYRRDKNTSI